MYTCTDRAVWFEDHFKIEIKITRLVVIDEAHYSPDNMPSYAKELMDLLEEQRVVPSPATIPTPTLKIAPTYKLPVYIIPALNKTGKKNRLAANFVDKHAHISPKT